MRLNYEHQNLFGVKAFLQKKLKATNIKWPENIEHKNCVSSTTHDLKVLWNPFNSIGNPEETAYVV